MNYNGYIQSIIDSRGQWNITGEYYEVHHIIPLCKGGLPKRPSKKSKHENVIWLYPEEHYIAHKLLALEHPNENGLQLAWFRMHYDQRRKVEITAEEYAILRKNAIESCKTFKGHHHSEETKRRISETRKARIASGDIILSKSTGSNNCKSKRCTIDGIEFETIKALGEYLGIKSCTLSNYLTGRRSTPQFLLERGFGYL